MRVYVITQGEYSDYGIVAVVTDKAKAEELQKLYDSTYDPAYIEEYETDDYYIEKGRFYSVEVGMRGAVKVREVGVPDMNIRNTVHLSEMSKLKHYWVIVKAADEEHAKKIGCDLVAKYKAERAGL